VKAQVANSKTNELYIVNREGGSIHPNSEIPCASACHTSVLVLPTIAA
jgi:hypothetical protein